MALTVRLLIVPRQKLKTAAMMHSHVLVNGGSLPFCFPEVNSHSSQSEENVLIFQSDFWSYFLEPQDMLNHLPETSIAVDAI